MIRTHKSVLTTIVLGALVIAGCGAKAPSSATSGTQTSGQTTTSTSSAALLPTPVPTVPAATKSVGTITWNLNFGEPLTMDTGKVVDYDDEFVLANLCEPLEELLPSGKVEPGLATSIDQTSPTTYVVHVRQGVKFWDGHTMTADDVAFSLNRQLTPSLGSYFMPLTLGAFKTATATGPDTVTIQLTRPNSVFERLLVTPLSMVVEKAFVQAKGSNYGSPSVGPMCTGPYQFVNWSPGQSITIKRNPNWWNAANQKLLTNEVKFVFIGDPNTSTEALLSGEVDGEFLVPAVALPKLQSSGGTLVEGPSTTLYTLTTTSLKGIGSNIKLRQAVAKLIDYAGVQSSQFLGTATVSRALAGPNTWGSAVPIYSKAYGELPAPTQDIAAAKQLVQQSGLKNPVVTIATTPVSVGASELVNQMAQAGQQAGITVQNKVLSVGQFGALFTSASARAKYVFMYQEANADIPDPLEFYDQIALPTGGENYAGYTNPAVTNLLNKANATFDLNQRATYTTQAQQLITQDQPWIPVVAVYLTTYMDSKIGGVQAALPSDLYWPWLTDVGGR